MKRSLLRVGAVFLTLFASSAYAKTSDAVKKFTTKANSNTTAWSYRAGDTGGHDGNYTLLTNVGTLDVTKNGKALTLKIWDTPSQGYGVPLFYADKSGVAYQAPSNAPFNVPAHTLVYHPGYGLVPAVLSFLAPKAGTATVNYDYTHLDWTCSSGQGILWSIEKNFGNGSLANGKLFSPNAQDIDTTGPQVLTVAVAKGDRINFILDPVANPPSCDSTGLQASVSIQ
jgi:hypothetical protein